MHRVHRVRFHLVPLLLIAGCSASVNVPGSLDVNGDSDAQNQPGGGDTQVTQPNGDNPSTAIADTDTPGDGDDVPPAIPRPAAIAGTNFATWKLTFHDEFDTVDTITAGSTLATGKLWYNGTEQCCMGPSDGKGGVMYPTPIDGDPVDPYSVVDGVLDITLQLKDDSWASGVLTSVDGAGNGFAQQYGYFEMRAQFPVGPGTWPAFWMLDQRSKQTGQGGGEIDIVEQYGQFPHGMCTTLHDWGGGTTPFYQCADTPNAAGTATPIDWTDGFHTVAMLWTESAMTVYVDDQVFATTTTPDVMKMPYYILVNLGIGGGWPTEQTPDPSVMQVDYVRVWGE